ncbi:MAG: hypothetical protein WCK98_04805 [bacterium]
MSQIRITKTKELDLLLEQLREELNILSDAEIMKLALSRLYKEYFSTNKTKAKLVLNQLFKKSKAYGDKFLATKANNKKITLSEEELYTNTKK